MKPTQILLAAIAASVACALVAAADDVTLPPASTKTGLTYATDIKPIFDANCVKCHSGDRPKARLHMDTLEGILKGTKQGKIVTPGAGANSILVKAVAHQLEDHDGWMPPMPNKAGANTLTPDQIGLVIAWINQGAN